MHLKRSKVPKNWPIARKGTKYITVANHASTIGIPLLVVLRDLIKIVRTKKEAKYVLNNNEIKVNNKVRKNEKFPIQVFDIVQIGKLKKNYKLDIVNKKLKIVEVPEKEANEKIVKIVGKKILGKDLIQMNLQDGQNFLLKENFNVKDSALVNTKENKVKKILSLKKGAKIEVISGKHAGEKGDLKEIVDLKRGKSYLIKLKEKEISLPLKTLLVVG